MLDATQDSPVDEAHAQMFTELPGYVGMLTELFGQCVLHLDEGDDVAGLMACSRGATNLSRFLMLIDELRPALDCHTTGSDVDQLVKEIRGCINLVRTAVRQDDLKMMRFHLECDLLPTLQRWQAYCTDVSAFGLVEETAQPTASPAKSL